MAERAHFDKKLFTFLRDLKRNNDRDWFKEHRPRYESVARDPMLTFIADFNAPLRKISEHFVADPRPVGGSMFRIHRDTRFAKDKSPYKTAVTAHFRHEAAKNVHAPGFYLHLEPGSVFAGVGIWHPDAETLRKVRTVIAEDPAAWKKAAYGKTFTRDWSLGGESLKKPPKGFDPEHPFVEDLKRKDFVAMAELSEADVVAPGFLDRYVKLCRSAKPFMEMLTRACGLPF